MEQKYPRNTQLDQRLDDAAARIRKEAHGTLPGVQRETFLHRPRPADTATPIWKSEDDGMLLGMERLGATATRIAAALNRDIDTVRARALFLGCPLPSVSDRRKIIQKRYSLTGRVD
jgi:hypothetical protein